MRHIRDIDDLSPDELEEVLARSADPKLSRPLEGAGVAGDQAREGPGARQDLGNSPR